MLITLISYSDKQCNKN